MANIIEKIAARRKAARERRNLTDLFLIVFLLAAICCPALAQPPLIITERGYFIVQSGPDGLPANVQITNVIDLREGGDDPVPPTDPDDPDEPAPPEPDIDRDIATKVEAWAKEIDDPMGAQAISWAYTRTRGDLSDGRLDPVSVWPELKRSTWKALDAVEGAKDWQPFADKLNAMLDERINDLQTVTAVSRMLRTIHYGIDQSHPEDVEDIDLWTLDQITRAIDG